MYLIRLDDATEYWDKEKWNKIAAILNKHNIKPIFAIIPSVEDPKLLQYEVDDEYWDTVYSWINEYNWTPALHGYNHVRNIKNAGINPINCDSEFAGLDLESQKEKIKNGYNILLSKGVNTKIFVAPGHTFDENTLLAIKAETPIRIISDTIANDVYKKDGLYFIPQQCGMCRELNFKTVTFCYHPNTMKEKDFIHLDEFLEKNKNKFISFDELKLKNRKPNIYDWILKKAYFIRRK